MTFPLYNECPNCGDKVNKHYPWPDQTLADCPLHKEDVRRAISIQAAVEVALQRAAK